MKSTTQQNDYFATSQTKPFLKALFMVSSVWVSQIISFAIKKGLLESIEKGKQDVSALAKELNFEYSILLRILKGLQHLGVIEFSRNKIRITDVGRYLLPNNTKSIYNMALLWNEEFFNAWSKLGDSGPDVTAGFERFYGMNIFEYLASNPEKSNLFNNAMNELAQLLYPEVAKRIARYPLTTLVDVGGGNGFLLSQVLICLPKLNATLFDLEHVINSHQATHWQLVAGDFFEKVPTARAHVLANILHDWDDMKALQILKNVRKAQSTNNLLFIVEMVVDHPAEPLLARSTDLNMLMITGGKERSLVEFKELLVQANFEFLQIENINDMTCLITAVAV